ncbi:MAG: hypothetical protein JXA75_02575 [Candidatus Thermoplasmatota archaeon]|nr:hypothetical protein [Candidatus Thermoplasmatota archaeon]
MKKITVSIFICVLMVATVVSVVGTSDDSLKNIEINTFEKPSDIWLVNREITDSEMIPIEPIVMTTMNAPVEVIDQQQLTHCAKGAMVYPPIWVAQGFTPTLERLTKVTVYFFKSGMPPSGVILTVHIRASLTGGNLATLSKDASEIPTSGAWVEFDLPDITVIPDNTYYLICHTSGGSIYDNYCWLLNINNVYQGGAAWESPDSGATWFLLDFPPEYPNIDFCFITYGLDESPDIPTIDGPASGKAEIAYDYNFSTTDPEGHNMYYFIDWGDDTNSGWIGPYPSGDEITKSHTWSKKGTYIIKTKAKDIYSAESDWATLTVTMPCSYNEPFFSLGERFFQRFPNAFIILRQLMGY